MGTSAPAAAADVDPVSWLADDEVDGWEEPLLKDMVSG